MDPIILDIARKAGNIIMKYYGQEFDIETKHEDWYDPVTQADKEADAFICSQLKMHYPDAGILSEESPLVEVDFSKPVWIIDPLDGTREFIRGGNAFSVMIGLLENSVLKCAAVYFPVTDKLFYAEKGSGAYLQTNDFERRIYVSDIANISEAKTLVKGPLSDKTELDYFVGGFNVKEKIPLHCTGSKLCAIAEGFSDFYINTTISISKWDTAAGHLILTEAGGKITDFSGANLDYGKNGNNWDNSFVISNGVLHDAVMNMLPDDAIKKAGTKVEVQKTGKLQKTHLG